MKIAKEKLEQLVREELTNYLSTLLEAKGDEPDVEDSSEKEKKPPKKTPPKDSEKTSKEPKKLEVPEDEEADEDLSDEVADSEDADDVTGGEIADKIEGKTIQSITMEPKSKTLPGAQEIVLTFREIPDPLKILILKNGTVKFFLKGVHNKL